jgi:DNA-binding transcriptional MocR family regulator
MFSINSVQLESLLGSWRRSGPAYADLAGQIRQLIHDAMISQETRLPAERLLAARLGVSRNTVTGAYGLLREDGYLVGRRGAGSFAQLPPQPGGLAAPARPQRGGLIDLTAMLIPDPEPLLGTVLAELADDWPRRSAGHDPLGIPELRQAMADRYAARGLPTAADSIMVTGGRYQAWDLLLRVLARPGRPVVIDCPAGPRSLSAIRTARGRPEAVGLGPAGWQTQALTAAIGSAGTCAAYLMPDFHHPTGQLMPEDTRAAIVKAAESAGVAVVVDDSLTDVIIDDVEMPRPMAAHARRGGVISIGSLAEPAWAGLGVGWLRAAPPLISRLAALRADDEPACSLIEQLVACRLLGRYDQLLAARCAVLRQRRTALAAALASDLPGWRFTVPAGGLSFWVELDAPVGRELAAAAAAHGVMVSSGPRYGTAPGTLEKYLCLPFVQDPATLREGIRRLAAAWASLSARR